MAENAEILLEIGAVARQAGDIALQHFGRVQPEVKHDRSFVTEADRRVEEFIREQITSRFPDDNIVGEEFQNITSGSSGYTWAIDPIDGTTNFVAGLPHWAVCIGRMDSTGRPDLGIVHVPVQDELYAGATGAGATLNGRTLRMMANNHPENEQLLAAWSSAFRDVTFEFSGKMRILGATIIKFLYLSRNCYVGALTPQVHVWDVAAGFPILWEAGGEARRRDDGSVYDTIDLDPANGYLVPPLILTLPEAQEAVRAMVRPRA